MIIPCKKFNADAYKLATDLAMLAKDYDYYDYCDAFDTDEEAIDSTLIGIFDYKEQLIEELKSMIADMEETDEEYFAEEINNGKILLEQLINFESEVKQEK